MILKYYALKCNTKVSSNYQTLDGAQKALVEKATYLEWHRGVCIANKTPMSFEASWYGGSAYWEVVEVSLELL